MRKENLKVVIAGGGSTYTPGIVKAMISKREDFKFTQLVLYDIDEKRNDDMFVIISYMLEQEKLDESVHLVQTLNPKEAFTDCDFVFSQIRVGGFEMREKDEKIPLKYGCVGQETCGLGGFAYGLRTIGGILDIVGYVQKYAPNAWILNYTNPESIVSKAVQRAYPDAKILNACDMTISIEETICSNFGYDRSNWTTLYYGLNHYGWYTSIYDKSLDRDVLPEIIDKIQNEGLKVASFNEGDKTWQDTWNMLRQLVINFPDYLPNNYLEYYLYPDVVVSQSNPEYTRANAIIEGRYKNTIEMAEKIRNHSKGKILNFNFGEHGNYIVEMAISILNDSKKRFILIVPNMGAIPNLRSDATVEVPAYVGATGAEPISLRHNINDFHKGLMEAQNAAEKLLVDAWFEHSYQKALQAFTLNQSIPSATVAKKILDEMIEVNKDYWPELK